MSDGRLVEVADTRLFVEERGAAEGFPLMVLHGGPGLDHHMFGDYLDPLVADGRYRLVFIDERSQGRSDRSAAPHTWTIERMAADISDLAGSLDLSSYAVLGHSFGAFVALQLHVSRWLETIMALASERKWPDTLDAPPNSESDAVLDALDFLDRKSVVSGPSV